MTSPSADLDSIMPYGLNVSAKTSSTYIHPDGDSSRIDGSFILLPVGPCQVQFTWPGKQDAYVRWVDSSINEKGIPIEISGGGEYSPKTAIIGAAPGDKLQVRTRSNANPGTTGTITVYPTPR